MIRLVIVSILLSLANSSNYDTSKINLRNFKKSLLESEEYMNKQPKNEDSVIFIGNTKSGKSTLINYLIGNKLKVVKISQFEPPKIIKVENGSKGPEMCSESLSKNTIPTRWTSKQLNDLTMWDAPDMDDNGEEIQDMIRSFYIFKLLQKVKSLKIILVLNIKDIIEDDTKNYLSLLTAVNNIFGSKFQKYFSSTSVIFTKVPNTINDIPVDYKYIQYHLKNQFLNDPGLKWSQVSKNFTQFLLNNSGRIALLKEMSNDGEITSDIDVNIFTAIKTSKIIPGSSLQDLRQNISSSSMLFLFQCSEIVHSNIAIMEIKSILERKFNKIKTELDNLNKNKNEVKKTKKELLKYRNILYASLKSESDFTKKLKYLYEVDLQIEETVKKYQLLENFQLITSIENLLFVKISKPLNFLLNSVVFSSELYLQSVILIANMNMDILLKNESKEKLKDVFKLQSAQISSFYKNLEKNSSVNTNIFNNFLQKIRERANRLYFVMTWLNEHYKKKLNFKIAVILHVYPEFKFNI